MRNDPFFKLVALIVVAGVLIALLGPTPSSASNAVVAAAAAQPLNPPATEGAQ